MSRADSLNYSWKDKRYYYGILTVLESKSYPTHVADMMCYRGGMHVVLYAKGLVFTVKKKAEAKRCVEAALGIRL